jgi:hypothetical protein
MPENMTPEKPQINFVGAVGKPVELPGATASMRYAKLLEEERSQWKNLNPNDPNYDPRMEAKMRGILGIERNYERDPLGLYSAAGNLAETMLKYNKIPLMGSPDFNSRIAAVVKRGLAQQDARDAIAEEIADTMTELDRNFGLALAADNRSVTETLMMIESFTPPKPFEANMQERELMEGRKMLQAMPVYFGRIDAASGSYKIEIPEKIAGVYRTFDGINEQQIGLFNILCATGGSLEGYYDALKQAGETLISRARYHANSTDFRAAYTDDDPGVTTHFLKPEEKAHIKDTLASKEIRETQVEMLSQARRLILFNVDVAQFDVDKPAGQEGLMRPNTARVKEMQTAMKDRIKVLISSGAMNKNESGEVDRLRKHVDSLDRVAKLDLENHRKFMRLVFGEIDEKKWVKWTSPDTRVEVSTPKEILTWNASSDKVEDREKWLSRMMAVLLWKEGGKGVSDFLETANATDILRVAKNILANAENIRLNIGDKEMNADPTFAAAKIALVSWIEKDKGFQKAGKLAWMYKYVDSIKGKPLGRIERVYDSGGLYKADDSINLYAYWRRWVSYKASWKSATTFFGPASDEWRRQVSKHAPDWLPPLDLSSNLKIQRLHDRFFKPEYRLWRAQRLTANDKLTEQELNQMITSGKLKEPSLDTPIAKHLLDNGWRFDSAWGLPIPMYLPKTFRISLDEMMVNKDKKETVEDLYLMGIMPKDVNWDIYNFESLDRMWVSQSMLVRFARYFVDPYDTERDSQWNSFFDHASTQNIAEMAKRVYLAFRDLPEGYQQYIVAIVPFMIAQQTASSVGLFSGDLIHKDYGTREKLLKKFNFRMSEWIRSAMWAPQVVLDDEQLYNGANADIQSMRNDIALMIMYYKHIFEKVAQAEAIQDEQSLQKYFRDQMSLYKGSLAGEMAESGPVVDVFSGEFTEKVPLIWSQGEGAVRALLFGERH